MTVGLLVLEKERLYKGLSRLLSSITRCSDCGCCCSGGVIDGCCAGVIIHTRAANVACLTFKTATRRQRPWWAGFIGQTPLYAVLYRLRPAPPAYLSTPTL